MTSLTFAFSRSIGRQLVPGDEIVVTRMDHEGNIAPWLEMAAERGVTIRWLAFDRASWTIEAAALDAVLSERTKLVALNYASNLTGSINNVRALTEQAKAAGALVYVDGVQYAPHRLTDVHALGCDFLACSSYKCFGPHMGIVWGTHAALTSLHPYKARPASDDMPWRFETGTPQIEQLAALCATVEYFEWLGDLVGAGPTARERLTAAFAAASAYEMHLAWRLIDGLCAIPGVTVHGITERERSQARVPTISFTHQRHSSAEIARALAGQNIFVWSGHNFALETARQLGIDEEDGVVRIGIAHYNTADEIESVVAAVHAACSGVVQTLVSRS